MGLSIKYPILLRIRAHKRPSFLWSSCYSQLATAPKEAFLKKLRFFKVANPKKLFFKKLRFLNCVYPKGV
jgi:hypothetical protein